MTPTQLSIRELKARGYTVAVVERWNPFVRIRQDLFGFADLLAFQAGSPVLLVQTTTKANTSARIKKISTNVTAAAWASAGNQIEVHGWYKCGRKWDVVITSVAP